ncbi:MAG: virginiamycin B lyase family protein [Hyphomicrobiaceae bacterium]
MRKNWLLSGVAGLAAFIVQAGPVEAQTTAALTGQVSSAEEGNMEGVVISAKKDGSTITISVVSDAQGRFSFPADRLEPGKYTLKARAVGYDLPATTADVVAGRPATSELKLTKTRNLSAQLNNAEWLLSMPGTDEQKNFLLGCNGCHTYQRIVNSSYDAQGFLQIFQRMGTYYPGSTPLKPQVLAGTATRDNNRGGANALRVAEWLSTVNLSQTETRQWPLKTLPRLKGKSTQVVITEYDLPNQYIQPHDVVLDQNGTVWYSDFGQQFLGKMDAKTGKVTQYPIPVLKPGYSTGTLDLEADKDGNIWIGVMYQANIAKFDPKTEKFTQWSVPKEWQTDGAQTGHLAVNATHVDGKVWIKNSDATDIYRLDVATGKFENLGNHTDPFTGRRIGTYGLHSDSQNNAYLLDFSGNNLVRIDAKTKALKFFKTPTEMSRPRRGRVDSQDRQWFAEYGGNAIGMLDPNTGNIEEYKVPTPWSAPYDAVLDAHGDAWTGSMLTDRVARLDTRTKQYTEYPLPRPTNIRRVFVDSRTKPGTLWIGSNHGASIVKVEPQS